MAADKSSRVNREYKTKYRVRNWSEYERGLKSRGDVTIWLSEAAVDATEERFAGRIAPVLEPRDLDCVGCEDPTEGPWAQREAALQRIRENQPRDWQKESGYRQQARVENGFSETSLCWEAASRPDIGRHRREKP
jgi:hypothetical protein